MPDYFYISAPIELS